MGAGSRRCRCRHRQWRAAVRCQDRWGRSRGGSRGRHLERQVVHCHAGVLRAGAGRAAVVAYVEAHFDKPAGCGVRHEAEVARFDVGHRDFRACGHWGAVQHDGAGGRQRRHDDGLEGVAFDGVVEAECVLRQHDRIARGEIEGVIGAGRSVVDGIDDDAQLQRHQVAVVAGDDQLVRRELAVVILLPCAGAHVQRLGIRHADQRCIAVGVLAVGHLGDQFADGQRGRGRVAGLRQHVAQRQRDVAVFVDVDRAGQENIAHVCSVLKSSNALPASRECSAADGGLALGRGTGSGYGFNQAVNFGQTFLMQD